MSSYPLNLSIYLNRWRCLQIRGIAIVTNECVVLCCAGVAGARPAVAHAGDRPGAPHLRGRGAAAPLHQRLVRRGRGQRGQYQVTFTKKKNSN